MPATIENLDEAIKESRRFINRALTAIKRLKQDRYAQYGCKETATAKRASMDLSNCLVKLRK